MAGNTIGPFVGRKSLFGNGTTGTLFGFASFTNVVLNSVDDDIPVTKWGLGLGGGYAWSISGDFQVGAIVGLDLFEGVGAWPYKYQPWISLGVGYSFTTNNREEKILKDAKSMLRNLIWPVFQAIKDYRTIG